MKQGGIYTITHLETGRIYIGSTNYLELRWKQHRYELEKGKHQNRKLQGSWNRHGGATFSFGVLEIVTDLETLLDREDFHVNDKKPFYNIAPVFRLGNEFYRELGRKWGLANKGRIHSEETRRKVSEAGKGRMITEETRRKLSEALKGRKLTAETKQKLSDAKKGRTLSEEHRNKLSEVRKGRPGTPHTEETRQKIAEKARNRTEHIRKLSEGNIGRKASEEARRKMSEAHKKRGPMPEETRQKLIAIMQTEEYKRNLSAGVRASLERRRAEGTGNA